MFAKISVVCSAKRVKVAVQIAPLGKGMAAYYGGRAETRIRRVPVPVVVCDFLSMYPTVNALMDSWRLLRAERIEIEDVTDEIQVLLSQVTLAGCFDPALWPRFLVLVQVEPDGEPFPVRARYRGSAGDWGIGLNHLSSPEPFWYTLPDLVAATLLGGCPPRVLRALRLAPHGVQPGLRPVRLRGEVLVEPRHEDFFRVVIQERHRVRDGAGHYASLAAAERESLEKFLKVAANSGGYGIYAELNARHDSKTFEEVLVFGAEEAPHRAEVRRPEAPGAFCFPPLAACITGAARLMLALFEACVSAAGGTFAFCDTDSMAIVAREERGLLPCPGDHHRDSSGRDAIMALSWAEVEGIRDRFETLNPYDRTAVRSPVLKIEDENFDPDTGTQRELSAFCISAKRYVLFNDGGADGPHLRKVSEHGLGHLLNPSDPEDPDRAWIRQAWAWLLAQEIGRPVAAPPWLDRPALTRITVSSPEIQRLFRAWNTGKAYAQQIKPANFLLVAHTVPFGHPPDVDPGRFLLIAPYSPVPREWPDLPWRNRFDPASGSYRISTGDPSFWCGDDVVVVKSYRQVLSEYLAHIEAKSQAPGGLPSQASTKGLLQRRSIRPATISYLGKEANQLEAVQHGLILDPVDVQSVYLTRPPGGEDVWTELVLPVLLDVPLAALSSETHLSLSALKDIRSGRAAPRAANAASLLRAAARFARAAVGAGPELTGDAEILAAYLATRKKVRACAVCGTALPTRRAKYCGPRCRQRAFRHRRPSSP